MHAAKGQHLSVRLDDRREFFGQPNNAFDALGLGAELLVEDNLI